MNRRSVGHVAEGTLDKGGAGVLHHHQIRSHGRRTIEREIKRQSCRVQGVEDAANVRLSIENSGHRGRRCAGELDVERIFIAIVAVDVKCRRFCPTACGTVADHESGGTIRPGDGRNRAADETELTGICTVKRDAQTGQA